MAEVIGKIFVKKEAEKFYGAVRNSASISTDELKKLITQTEEYIMIRENSGQVEVLNHARTPLFPKELKVTDDVVFYRMSTSVLEELLKKGGEQENSVETRHSVFTISNGENLLEMTMPCPPFCH